MKSLITIESLTKKGKTKYTVKTSEDSVTVSEDDVVKYRILKGATFTEEEWESIKKGVTKANAWDKVLNFYLIKNVVKGNKRLLTKIKGS